MSGLAEILHNLGYIVQGSDECHSQNIERLEKLGINIFTSHNKNNIDKADIVVYSAAIKQDNVELLHAKEKKIPCLSRAEMLSQIVRMKKSIVIAGSHGKTTTTSICANILEMALFDPTVVNGGIINAYQSNAKLGTSEWTVIEADESDGSFVHFFPIIGIVTNIDNEHCTHYGSFENLKNAFKIFINNIPFFGAAIVCTDCENVCKIIANIQDRKIITYSTTNDSMFKAVNIRCSRTKSVFDVLINNSTIEKNFEIPILGNHNIQNALAAIAMSYEMKIDIDIVRASLQSFSGVMRRFSTVGQINNIQIIDDYAHHPTEIKALLQSGKQTSNGKIVIICQPHRYTRLNLLFQEFSTCFDLADTIILVPIYQASENSKNYKLTSEDLTKALVERKKNAIFASTKEVLENTLAEMIASKKITEDDIIIFSGAGSISKWAKEITKKLGTTN